jgi:hypothetical protein
MHVWIHTNMHVTEVINQQDVLSWTVSRMHIYVQAYTDTHEHAYIDTNENAYMDAPTYIHLCKSQYSYLELISIDADVECMETYIHRDRRKSKSN